VDKFCTYATSLKTAGTIPDEAIGFMSWLNPSRRAKALGSTQLLTEMSTRNLLGGKGRPAHKADDFTAVCGKAIQKMWEPQHFITPWATTTSYRDNFTFFFLLLYYNLIHKSEPNGYWMLKLISCREIVSGIDPVKPNR
jgi:hypothetical protein